jgi:uncharacterized membrane protein
VSRDKFGAWDTIRRAFAEFLAAPTAIIVGFLLLAAVTYMLDRAALAGGTPLRQALETHVFGHAKATSDLLGTIATGLITVTSITISLLLLAVQQSATAMTSEVLDQFLRRRINQVYFGTFVGLALYALITLATVHDRFNPVYGGTVAFLSTVVALYLLIVLLYTTIIQMRPVEIIEAIHHHTLVARERQLAFIARTQRRPLRACSAVTRVAVQRHGYVTRIDLERIATRASPRAGDMEVVLLVSIGDFVAFGDHVAEIRTATADPPPDVVDDVRRAVHLEIQRDIGLDPGFGIEQIETIAWTSISTSKSNPAPGMLGIRSLRDLLARWSEPPRAADPEPPFPVVYTDNVMDRLMDAFETLAVVSSESMQHQNFGEVLRALTGVFDRLRPAERRRAEDLILRIISALGEHVLTADLDDALTAVADTLAHNRHEAAATAVRKARAKLGASVGHLNSRSSRVPRPA